MVGAVIDKTLRVNSIHFTLNSVRTQHMFWLSAMLPLGVEKINLKVRVR